PDLTKYKECFTFKWRENRQHQRLYGFLHHPKRRTHPSFQVCVLVYHDTKNEEETDFAVLDRINQLRKDSLVIAAIDKEFPEERCVFSGSSPQGFSPSFPHHFHDHPPAIFTIIHPPFSSSCTHPGVFHLQLLAECSSLATIRYGVSLLLASWRSESPFSFGSSKKVAFRKP